MHFTLDHLPISLLPGIPLTLWEGDGTSLRILRGRVWVTEEGLVDDLFLEEGAVHTISNAGRAVITAEGPARAHASVLFDSPLSVQSPSNFIVKLRRALIG